MAIDPSSFYPHNVTDTCAVWNILSSEALYRKAKAAGICFICTGFVLYECLIKPRKEISPAEEVLRDRLRNLHGSNTDFKTYPLTIENLQEVEILEKRKNLGKGELSSIAFAKITRQAFLTDDQKARKLGAEVLGRSLTQTTPHMLSWLIFSNIVSDHEKGIIIKEHAELDGPLSNYFEEAYLEACRCRLMAAGGPDRPKSGSSESSAF